MTLNEYSSLDASALAELVKRSEVSANELASLALEAISLLNPKLNAVTEVYEGRAAKADSFLNKDSPFAGVPFLMKDFGACEKGKKQEMGSRLTKGYVAQESSALTHYFKEAGLSLLGRTTAPEFALSLSTESIAFGQTRNPWNLERLAGGSSGGAAAIVAAGAVPLAHATDAAGSIRIPASACGLVGLKPSRGRVSSAPFGESVAGMNTEFVLCRSLRDAAAMLDAVSKPIAGDPFIISKPEHSFLDLMPKAPKRLRIAFTTQSWSNHPQDPVDTEVVDAVKQTAKHLQDLGHELIEASPAFEYQRYLDALCTGWAYGFSDWLDGLGQTLGRQVSKDTLEPVSLSLYTFSKTLSVKDMLTMDATFNTVKLSVGRFFETYDLLLTPTLTQLPEPLGKYTQSATDVDFRGFFRRCDEACNHLPLANLTGQPALSLPLYQSQSGLPIGMHFMAKFGNEAVLLQLAHVLEQVLPWEDRKPAVHSASGV